MSAEDTLSRCLTCFQTPLEDNMLDILGDENNDIGEVLSKHFWFSVDAFHRFYLSVEILYRDRILMPAPVSVKLEQEEVSPDNTLLESTATNSVNTSQVEPEQLDYLSEESSSSSSHSSTCSSDDDFQPEEDSSDLKEATFRRGRKRMNDEDTLERINDKRNDLRCRSKEERLKTDEYIREHVKYICQYCGEDSPTFTSFQKHAVEEHDEKPAFVSCCGNKYYKKGRLYQHVQVVNDPETFRCEQCQKNFTDNEGIKRHMREFHASEEDKKYKCDRCPKSFVGKYKYKIHVRDHDDCESRKLKCDQCEKFFKSHHTLTKHIKLMHVQPTDYICDICAMGFHSKTNFVRHRQEHETSTDQKAQCDVCLRWFKSRQSVLRHKVEHEGPPNQKKQCEICLRWLKNRNSWRRHMHQHVSTEVTCEICSHVSPNQRALIYHKKRMHSDVQRPEFECSHCQKTFAKRLTLREHVAAQHTREVLYTCSYCPKTSNSNANMYAHKKSAHPKEWWEERNNKFYKK